MAYFNQPNCGVRIAEIRMLAIKLQGIWFLASYLLSSIALVKASFARIVH